MKKTNNRLARLETDIKKILAEVVTYSVKDPRIGTFAAITRVELTRDFSYATVYISGPQSGQEEQRKKEANELLEGLESAKGFLRKKLAEELTIHRIPELIFKYDDTAEYLRHIDDLLEQVAKKGVNTHTIPEIGGILQSDTYQKIAIFPQIFADGDAVGSAVAMYHALRELGKKDIDIVMTEPVASNLAFLTEGLSLSSDLEKEYDLVISVDTSSMDQFRDRMVIFENAGATMSIDHHKTNQGFADFVYVDPTAAAAGEILYYLLLDMGVVISKEIAEALYTAISTDTGSFRHPNATARTFFVVSKLMEAEFDFHKVSTALYKNIPFSRMKFLQMALDNLDVVFDELSISHIIDISAENSSDYEGITDYLLSFEGIEVAAFCRRLDEKHIKFSLRSKNDVDVSRIASEFGGGGHMRAAGFITEESFDEVKDKIIAMYRKEVDE